MSSQRRSMWFPHFRHGQRAMNMNRCTKLVLLNIHFIYNLANGNGRVVVRFYGEDIDAMASHQYPTRWQPNPQTFSQVHQNLAEHESFRATIDDSPSILKWTW
ncbi:hypothetical protein TNCV_4233801 [Trichonephila clavipes]|nr:hypothetical protein TNCV_4233801 [Trichonephila clavipes]